MSSNTITSLPEISLLQESCYLPSEDSRVLQAEPMPLIKICCTVLNIRRNYTYMHVTTDNTSIDRLMQATSCVKENATQWEAFPKNQTSPIKRKKRKNENVSDKAQI